MKKHGHKGFTLLEVVITLVVAAILATILMQFMGTSLTRSTEPLVLLQEGLELGEIMEKMTADYKRLLATDSAPLESFKSNIENGNVEGNIPYFGSYSIETKYISFSGGTEEEDTSGDNLILKVIINVTGLFVTVKYVCKFFSQSSKSNPVRMYSARSPQVSILLNSLNERILPSSLNLRTLLANFSTSAVFVPRLLFIFNSSQGVGSLSISSNTM